MIAWLAFPDDRGPVSAVCVEVRVEAVVGDVRLTADKPFGKRLVPTQRFGSSKDDRQML